MNVIETRGPSRRDSARSPEATPGTHEQLQQDHPGSHAADGLVTGRSDGFAQVRARHQARTWGTPPLPPNGLSLQIGELRSIVSASRDAGQYGLCKFLPAPRPRF